jgi:TonB family protein
MNKKKAKRNNVLAIFFIMLIGACCQNNHNSSIIESPSFPGGIEARDHYIKENMHWTQSQITVGGTVFVSFLVNEDGKISNVKVEKSLCDACDKEAVRLVRGMPDWIPAQKDGKPVTSKAMIAIRFGLAEN